MVQLDPRLTESGREQKEEPAEQRNECSEEGDLRRRAILVLLGTPQLGAGLGLRVGLLGL